MSDGISAILSQIRGYQGQLNVPVARPLQSGLEGVGRNDGVGAAQGVPGFSETLGSMLRGVSDAQAKSGALQTAFELGDPRADLARVMVAQQQASVAFKATVEVRNRLVQAYQDVMNMPV
ncbi:flagellar hook-basal body complex protein FliE [Coralloluteibacterium thermophilus]|uniref:Flagellar hook-basal body complex protein FliE n=1 Tax=Coralloluteibacterium thermophilum TaxID=2707049 RepID=A0ABV9NG58_9GAMM